MDNHILIYAAIHFNTILSIFIISKTKMFGVCFGIMQLLKFAFHSSIH